MPEFVTVNILLDSEKIGMTNPIIDIEKNVGDHTRLKIQGIVKEESYGKLLAINTKSEVQVQYGDTTGNLFWGIVTHIDIQVRASEGKQYQEIYLEARSFSCLMDRDKKYYSFQKPTVLYKEVVEFILKDYEGANYIFSQEASGKCLNRFTVQYNETDWEFLKRIASFLHLPLVVSHKTKGAKFTLGVVWKPDVYQIPKEDEWQVEIIHSSIERSNGTAEEYQGEQQYFKWNVENQEAPVFEVGDCVLYKGIQCYVKKVDLEIINHMVTQQCLLYGKRGFYVPEERNLFITGLSLPGSVKDVKNNQLQVALDVDALNENECWFLYSTFYSTFYCMPEKGDRVNLYFPDNVESHAFVLNSVRTVPQEAAIRSDPKKTEDSTGKEGQQEGVSSDSQVQAVEKTDIDISPILQMLANPENGKLINASVTYKDSDEAVPSEQVEQAGNQGRTSGINMGSTSAWKPQKTQPDYDFQKLAANENTKVLCSKGGKMVILDDSNGSVSIVCNDGTFISLAGSEITIASSGNINFHAGEDIKINAGKTLTLSAKDNIQINCDQSGLDIVPEKISIQGTDVKINE